MVLKFTYAFFFFAKSLLTDIQTNESLIYLYAKVFFLTYAHTVVCVPIKECSLEHTQKICSCTVQLEEIQTTEL